MLKRDARNSNCTQGRYSGGSRRLRCPGRAQPFKWILILHPMLTVHDKYFSRPSRTCTAGYVLARNRLAAVLPKFSRFVSSDPLVTIYFSLLFSISFSKQRFANRKSVCIGKFTCALCLVFVLAAIGAGQNGWIDRATVWAVAMGMPGTQSKWHILSSVPQPLTVLNFCTATICQ